MMLPEYRNEPFTDFSDPANQAAMEAALAAVHAQFGATYPIQIGGERISTEQLIRSLNPAAPSEIVGYTASATPAMADQAIRSAYTAFESWRKVPVADRVALLMNVSEEIRRRKFELCAWIIYEVSKSWAEADGDVAEAIDFCEYYAREMLRLDQPQKIDRKSVV